MTSAISPDLLQRLDAQRTARGFLTVARLLDALTALDIVVLDPFSTLVSENVVLGRGNVLYPNVVIETQRDGEIALGGGNVLYPGTLLLADSGTITVGDDNQFGPGGLHILALDAASGVAVGSGGRYMQGAEISAPCLLGSGSQILGAISARNCQLGAGEGHRHPDAAARGGVLKGVGRAHNLVVGVGEVINGSGSFRQADVESQLAYHPQS
jgi:carbonic anhydrase/acetyltransferase-like protein (isoleucine patch superfamily)